MKNSILILSFVTSFISAFSQPSPFNNCWLFQEHYSTADYNSARIKIDTVGRGFLSVSTSESDKNKYRVLDENGNKISTSPYEFSAVALSGNYYHWHSITDLSSGNTDAVIEKVDPFNNIIWTDTLGAGSGINEAVSFMTAVGESVLIAGTVSDGALETTNTFVAKYDEAGNQSWINFIGENNDLGDYPAHLLLHSNGKIFCQGYTTGNEVNSREIYVTAISDNGSILWIYIEPGDLSDNASGLVEGDNGSCYYIVTSNDDEDPYGNQLFGIGKLDANGNAVAGTGSFHDENFSLAERDSEGNLVIASVEDYFGEPVQLFLRKFDGNLNLLWTKSFDGLWHLGLLLDEQNNVYDLVEDYDGVTLATVYKFSPDGNQEWKFDKEGKNGGDYRPGNLDLRLNNQAVVMGINGYSFQNPDLNLFSLDGDGNLLWDQNYDEPSKPINAGLSKLNDFTYYVAGEADAADNEDISDHFCIKLCIPASSCPLEAVITPSEKITECQGTTVTLTCTNEAPDISYQWRMDGTEIPGAIMQSHSSDIAEGIFDVIVTSAYGCSDISDPVEINRKSKPKAKITPLGDLDICVTGSVDLQASSGNNYSYQWKLNGANIPGVTNQVYTATEEGDYKVKVTSNFGCNKTSKVTTVFSSCKLNSIKEAASLEIYPNPSSGNATIYFSLQESSSVTIELTDVSGRLIKSVFSGNFSKGNHELSFDGSELTPGIYFVQLKSENDMITEKLILQ